MAMDSAGVTSVDGYLASQPVEVRAVLERVRAAIRKGVPGAQESISYRIPTYKVNGRPVIYFAGFRHHYSVYPANRRLVEAFRDELEPYEFNNRGTVRFPYSARVPGGLITRLARFRAREVAEGAKAKAVPRKKR
jgi:uncharacterized protein YdhG (YjbR/CyaY superfamily)